MKAKRKSHALKIIIFIVTILIAITIATQSEYIPSGGNDTVGNKTTGETEISTATTEISDVATETSTAAVSTDGAASKIITSEDILLSSVKNMLSVDGKPVTQKPTLPKVTHTSDFTLGSARTLHGIYSSTELYFTLPLYWDTQYACIQIEYRVSQLMKNVPSSLTFSINKQPFYSCKVEYENNEAKSLYVLIPKALLKNDTENRSNYLEVSGYAHLYDQEGCIDNNSDANWITISEASGVQVGYETKAHNNRIDYYPYPFMSQANKTGADTAIEVANAFQNEEAAAAMSIMSNLSKQTVGDNRITVGTWNDLKEGSYKNRIFIGLSKDTPPELQKYINQYKDQLKGQALILFVNDDNKQPLLMIVSEDADCLMEAGYLLADNDRVSQEKDSVTFIKKGSADIKVNAKKLGDMKADKYTLQEMTGGGFEFVGSFHQVKTLFLPIATDYTLSSASKVSINFRYSKNLDFKRSMITVYWGDIPIGSKKLTLEKADKDELTFFMPADVVGTYSSNIKFAFDLEITDLYCTTRQDEMPWAYITKDSSLYLPIENNVKLSFENKPAPFQKNGSLNDVMLILSDNPTSSELTLLGRTLAIYGKSADAYGKLKICKVSEFSEKDSNYNIITSGTPSTNNLISKINDKLYFKYNADGTRFLTNEKLILSSDYAESIGTLQLIQSPYAQSRALLVLTGPKDDTLKMVTKLVSNEKMGWNLKNDCVLIDSEGKIKSFQFQNDIITGKTPTLAQSIGDNKNSLFFALAGTSVMLVLFLAMVLILIRLRLRKK
ncbi:MAG TPA: cellulose biosynthesis cyclic di-GMP-binding regulatory protein BcsB [Ruminiclostridium sp.]